MNEQFLQKRRSVGCWTGVAAQKQSVEEDGRPVHSIKCSVSHACQIWWSVARIITAFCQQPNYWEVLVITYHNYFNSRRHQTLLQNPYIDTLFLDATLLRTILKKTGFIDGWPLKIDFQKQFQTRNSTGIGNGFKYAPLINLDLEVDVVFSRPQKCHIFFGSL